MRFAFFHCFVIFFSVAWGNDMFEGSDGYAYKEFQIVCEMLNSSIGNVKCVNAFKSRFHRYNIFKLHLLVQADKINLMMDYTRGSRVNNHYPIPGAKFNVSVCSMFRLNLWGAASYTTTDGNLTQCPVKPGFYHMSPSDVSLSDSNKHTQMPKNIPEGDYKGNVTLIINDVPFFRAISYVSFGRPASTIEH